MVTTTADLNLHPDLNGNVKIFCSQYDNALREIVFNIYDGDTLADLTDLTAKVEGTKPDKYGYSYDATIRTSNSTVTVTLVTQMTCVAGLSHAEIVLYDDDSRVGTANFLLMVEEAGISDDTIVSDSVIPGIHNIDTLVEYAQTYADNAEASALEAEGYASGTQNGVAVSSDSQYYENNAKYYSEHAFSTTPEGYEALVNQVETNTTDISNTKSVIGSSYNASTNYAVGDRFADNGVRYKVNVPCIGITPPNANYYEVISVDEDTKELESEIDTLNSSLTDISAKVAEQNVTVTAQNGCTIYSNCYIIGDFCYINIYWSNTNGLSGGDAICSLNVVPISTTPLIGSVIRGSLTALTTLVYGINTSGEIYENFTQQTVYSGIISGMFKISR